MAPLTAAEMDVLDERFHACVDRIAAGDLAILAAARGEAINPAALTLAADAMAELLAEPRLEGTTWTLADVERREVDRIGVGERLGVVPSGGLGSAARFAWRIAEAVPVDPY